MIEKLNHAVDFMLSYLHCRFGSSRDIVCEGTCSFHLNNIMDGTEISQMTQINISYSVPALLSPALSQSPSHLKKIVVNFIIKECICINNNMHKRIHTCHTHTEPEKQRY